MFLLKCIHFIELYNSCGCHSSDSFGLWKDQTFEEKCLCTLWKLKNLISWQIFLRFLLKEIHVRLLESFFFRTCIWEVEDFCKYLHLLTTRFRKNILYRTVQCRSGTLRAHLWAEMLCRNVSANRAKHIVTVKITCFPFSFCSFNPTMLVSSTSDSAVHSGYSNYQMLTLQKRNTETNVLLFFSSCPPPAELEWQEEELTELHLRYFSANVHLNDNWFSLTQILMSTFL